MSESFPWLKPRVRSMQIIALALPAGAIAFVAVAIFIRQQSDQPPPETPVLSFVAIGFFLMQAVTSFVLPRIIRDASLKAMAANPARATPEALVGLFQTTLIISLALLESSVFMAAIAYIIEGVSWALAPAIVGVVLMAMKLPTEIVVLDWLQKAGDRVAELRGPT